MTLFLQGDANVIFITGSAGQVGATLLRQLIKQNCHIKAIVTKYDDTTAIQHPNVQIVVGDVCDNDFLIEQFEDATIVFHVAGIISISPGENERMDVLMSVV